MQVDHGLIEVEQKYKLVLQLAGEQLDCIKSGEIDKLPTILHQKVIAVNEAGDLMAGIEAVEDDKTSPHNIQLAKLGELIGEVMRLEDECQKLMAPKPAAPPTPSAARVASLYSKGR